MRFSLTELSDLPNAPFDEVIDVRAPAEFALDHLPGAINLPVLSDVERARVGTIYVQHSRLEARKIGAALVARNVAAHIDTHFAGKPSDYKPLVYCWRGGQRSGSMSLILGQIGWRVAVLDGGYRSYRHLVNAQLYDAPFGWRLAVVEGNTGCAKTDLLKALPAHGLQIVDLEGLAMHRGSVFGGFSGAQQPSQKQFESRLAQAFTNLDPSRPVIVEGESSKIGRLTLPPALWHAMCAAPRVEVTANLDQRAQYLIRAYSDIVGDPVRLEMIINRMRATTSAEQIDNWHQLVQSGENKTLAASLMAQHYDPAYAKSRGRYAAPTATLDLADLSDKGIARSAHQLVTVLRSL